MPLPRAQWSPLFLAIKNSLINRSGLLSFSHGYLRKAVGVRYLIEEASQQRTHLRIARYFLPRDLSPRKLDELPWQLSQARAWDELHSLLADTTFCSALYRHCMPDALRAWVSIERETNREMIDAYRQVLLRPAGFPDHVLEVIATLLDVTGRWSDLLQFRKTLVEHYARTHDIPRLAANILGQASLLSARGNANGALRVLADHGSLVLRSGEPWILQEALRIQSQALWQKGELDDAMKHLIAREKLCRGVPEFAHELAGTLVHESFIMQLMGDPDTAQRVLSEAKRISRESGDMGAFQAVVGECGLILLQRGELEEAIAKFSEQERICRELGDLTSLAGCLGNLGVVYTKLEREDQALASFEEMEKVASRVGHSTLYHVARSSQAAAIYRAGQGERARAMNDEAIAFFRINDLAERLATALLLRGHICACALDPVEADRAYEEAFAILKKLTPPRNVADAMCKAGRHYLAVFVAFRRPSRADLTSSELESEARRRERVGQYLDHAEQHLRKATRVCPDCADAHQSLAGVLIGRGNVDGAISSLRRVLKIRPDSTEVMTQLAELLLSEEMTE